MSPRRSVSKRLRAWCVMTIAVAVASCSSDHALLPPAPVVRVVAALSVASGGDQHGTVGTVLPQPVVVVAMTSDGLPVGGVAVSWTGDGSAESASATTDSAGRASVQWHLGTVAGTQQLHAAASGITVTVSAQAAASKPASLTILSGERQRVVVAHPTSTPVVVAVSDRYGNRVPGAGVRWIPDTAAGTPRDTVSTSDSIGVASTIWTMPTRAGAAHLHARADSAETMFTATALPDVASQVIAVSGDKQDAPYGVTLATPLVARAADRYGNGVANVSVRVVSDAGTLRDSTLVSDSLGTVSMHLRLPLSYGTANIRMSLDSGSAVAQFTATSRAATFAQVQAGMMKTCALTVEGYAFCWGVNRYGTLGVTGATGENVARPLPVLTSQTFSSIASNVWRTCALDKHGQTWCWGDPDPNHPATTPVALNVVQQTTPFVDLSVGVDVQCALDAAGAAYCWGNNAFGELGSTVGYTFAAVPVATTLRFRTISAGYYHVCGLDFSGSVWCWGADQFGQLGTTRNVQSCAGGTPCSYVPLRVPVDQPFVAIVSAFEHTCGLTAAGDAYCWGEYDTGQLGAGPDVGPGPVAVGGGQKFTSLTGSMFDTCGLTTPGTIMCWGANLLSYGLPPNQTCHSPTYAGWAASCDAEPTALPTNMTFQRVSIGEDVICGLSTGGDLYCWGSNPYGEAGIGTFSNQMMPVRVLGQP